MGMARSLNRNGSRRHINHGHFYLALEPYIRRTWPELLVSWARILSGEFTDPIVGRDLFLGILLGPAQVSLWVSLVASPFF